jgi:hypothetical protein
MKTIRTLTLVTLGLLCLGLAVLFAPNKSDLEESKTEKQPQPQTTMVTRSVTSTGADKDTYVIQTKVSMAGKDANPNQPEKK